ncbi:MAG: preprotein translocase subunit YajC [Phycisphaerales bacterium]
MPDLAIDTVLVLAQADAGAQPVKGVLGAGDQTATEGQPAGPDGSGGAGGTAKPSNPFGGFFFPLILAMIVLMVFTTITSGRKEKKKKAEMMSSLARHDRVQTIGGVIGTIVEIDAESVVLRVHESSDTRVRFARSAIQQVLRSGSKGGAGSADTEPDKNAA